MEIQGKVIRISSLITIVSLALAAIIVFYLYFNRDPVRQIPPGKNVVSPADGKIIGIVDLSKIKKKEIKIKKGLMGEIKTIASDIPNAKYLISIFMSVFDMHVQRAPVGGNVISTAHKKGKFLIANKLKALIENEKNEVVIENKDIGKIKVIQAAGAFARRVVCFAKKSEILLKGQRIGRIKLGSQVVLIIPGLKLKVKKGMHVSAGETIIAEY